MSRIITLEEYAMGRDKLYPAEWAEVKGDAVKFLDKLNGFLFEMFPEKNFYLASGWRPERVNATIGGASHSYHIKARAADLRDKDRWLKANLRPDLFPEQAQKLRDWGLFMEDPAATPDWCHVDDGDRVDRHDRIFKP